MAAWQEPEHLNWELSTQTIVDHVNDFIQEGLSGVNEKGERYPILITEMPTVQNGGIKDDGKTITYKLKKGVKWHDGADFTCEDLQFTQKVIMTPNNGALDTGTFKDLAAVECPDPNTAVLEVQDLPRRLGAPLRRHRPDLPEERGQAGGSQDLGVEPQAHRHRPVQGRGVRHGRSHHARAQRQVPC